MPWKSLIFNFYGRLFPIYNYKGTARQYCTHCLKSILPKISYGLFTYTQTANYMQNIQNARMEISK